MTLATPLRDRAGDDIPVSAGQLRESLRAHAAGVTVVTVPGPAGFTASSFLPVSLEPPLVAVHLGLGASTAGAVAVASRFAVHVLGAHQHELARHFARSGVDRFAGVAWSARHGVPLLRGVPRWLVARVVLRQELGDHLQVVGEVVALGGDAPDHPHGALVHHEGRLKALPPHRDPPPERR